MIISLRRMGVSWNAMRASRGRGQRCRPKQRGAYRPRYMFIFEHSRLSQLFFAKFRGPDRRDSALRCTQDWRQELRYTNPAWIADTAVSPQLAIGRPADPDSAAKRRFTPRWHPVHAVHGLFPFRPSSSRDPHQESQQAKQAHRHRGDHHPRRHNQFEHVKSTESHPLRIDRPRIKPRVLRQLTVQKTATHVTRPPWRDQGWSPARPRGKPMYVQPWSDPTWKTPDTPPPHWVSGKIPLTLPASVPPMEGQSAVPTRP